MSECVCVEHFPFDQKRMCVLREGAIHEHKVRSVGPTPNVNSVDLWVFLGWKKVIFSEFHSLDVDNLLWIGPVREVVDVRVNFPEHMWLLKKKELRSKKPRVPTAN